MFPFLKRKTKKDLVVEARRKRVDIDADPHLAFFEKYKWTSIGLFVCATLLLSWVCFWNQSGTGPKVIPNQMARVQIVAEFDFSYESEERTKLFKEQRQQMVAPAYQIDRSVYDLFSQKIELLKKELAELVEKIIKGHDTNRLQLIKEFRDTFSTKENLKLNAPDLTLILEKLSTKERNVLIDEGLFILKEIFREGIYGQNNASTMQDKNVPYFLSIEIDGRKKDTHIQSEADAMRFLRMNIWALDISEDISSALFHILKLGIKPNLVYDPETTQKRIQNFLESTDPIVVKRKDGDVIIPRGAIVSTEQYEELNVYRQKVRERQEMGLGIDTHFLRNYLFTAVVMLFACLYVRIIPSRMRYSKRCIGMSFLVLFFNLFFMRMLMELGNSVFLGKNVFFLGILPFTLPIFWGTILISILIDASAGLLMAFLLSAFAAAMQGCGIDVLFPALLAGAACIQACRDVRFRSRVIRAGAIGGVILGICAFFVGRLIDEFSFTMIGYQALASIANGVISGVLAIGIFPLLEHLFRYTTDITLLELTDYNHPLLRKLQLSAPGTYHHSLMVATLAERAAVEIDANPLICRASALFHDIGKILKPDYFSENQKEGINPHEEKNPSMSALILKSHVKEGLELAKEQKLPKIVLDIICQHHGTTLIQYFYHKALKLRADNPNTDEPIEESTFRYDGPKPLFKESAIVFFADCIEAASRSLQKLTPQSIEELIDRLFAERTADHQLEECPITFQEIQKIKTSFNSTLLNMLHARVSYPKKEENRALIDTPQ